MRNHRRISIFYSQGRLRLFMIGHHFFMRSNRYLEFLLQIFHAGQITRNPGDSNGSKRKPLNFDTPSKQFARFLNYIIGVSGSFDRAMRFLTLFSYFFLHFCSIFMIFIFIEIEFLKLPFLLLRNEFHYILNQQIE